MLAAGAHFFPAGKVPFVRKVPALFRFYIIDDARLCLHVIKKTGAVGFLYDRKGFPVWRKTCIAADELVFRDAEMCGNRFYFGIGYADRAFPHAACAATQTFEVLGHTHILPHKKAPLFYGGA